MHGSLLPPTSEMVRLPPSRRADRLDATSMPLKMASKCTYVTKSSLSIFTRDLVPWQQPQVIKCHVQHDDAFLLQHGMTHTVTRSPCFTAVPEPSASSRVLSPSAPSL